MGRTALALLAFLGSGYATGNRCFVGTVDRGMAWLASIQGPDGTFPGDAEDQALATPALAACHRMTAEPRWREPIVRGSRALAEHLHQVPPDPYTLGWTMLLLRVAAGHTEEGATVAPSTLALDPALSNALDAALAASGNLEPVLELYTAVFRVPEPRKEPWLDPLATLVASTPPDAATLPGDDLRRWYFGLLGLWRTGGPPWKKYSKDLGKVVAEGQGMTGWRCCDKGSWPATGGRGAATGRAGATALRLLLLQHYYRYDSPLFDTR